MASSKQDATCSFSLANDMTCRRCAENAVLTNQQLLDTICSTDFGNELADFGVVESPVAADDQERAFNTFRYREKDGSDERLAVMRLLEDLDFLSQTRCTRSLTD